MTTTVVRTASTSPAHLRSGFLALLPRIEAHSRLCFRGIPCDDRREEAVANALALAWSWYVRLVRRGKEPSEFTSTLAVFAVKAVNAGRRVGGSESSKDVLSFVAQRRHGFSVGPLPHTTRTGHERLYAVPDGQRQHDAFEEVLHDNTRTPVPDQVQFRLDFPAWLLTRTDRDRKVIADLMRGEPTGETADRYGMTAGRVSQLRREFCEDWKRFTGESN
jgi:hypothetical protein